MRILIIKTTSLGDIIQSFPVITFLRSRFPDASIDWALEKPFKELLEAHPDINRVIPIELRKWRKNFLKNRFAMKRALKSLRTHSYDLLIDLQGNIKSGILTKLSRAKEKIGTNFSSAPEWPNAFFLSHRYPINKKEPISLQYLSLVQKHFAIKPHSVKLHLSLTITPKEESWISSQLTPSKKIMICPGSHWENKKLSLPTWIEVLKKFSLEKKIHFYFVWGNEKEKQEAIALQSQFPEKSTLLPKMSLPLWQRLMSHMNLILTVDSSALHLAATTNTPTYSFFGPSSASIYKPVGDHHRALQGPCPYGSVFTKRCPALRTCKTGACIKQLTIKELC